MIKTKHYYKPIGVTVVACLIIAAPFMIFTLERPPAYPVAQEMTIDCDLLNQNETIQSYERGFQAGYVEAYADIIDTLKLLDYNPAYVVPERKPDAR